MADNDVIAGNKLIAEFMGYKYYAHNGTKFTAGWKLHDNPISQKLMWNGDVGIKIYLCRSHKDLLFDKSWDWLLCAIEKIESLGYVASINGNDCLITDSRHSLISHCNHFSTKRKTVWMAVEAFVNFYNRTTNPPQKP